ncbi:TVP38/TMEM64 family protein [Candidatus Phycosocius spiralis]|uniref:TVP38/TMEM64 family membrane protein n=1 Tax=Candidatus Phycosocius spiralis TaxID=2815099 RepID=A0ABQ4PXL1_9PROT|nr:VTT domain-containing protein [Candidatus Phycosocius spiralis]GIU67404.1 hypothetical protein PsB1_1558 [Candidatus Phycosocius spiralis]
MPLWLKRLYLFFTQMDSTAARAVWVAVFLFSLAGIVVTIGMVFIDLDQSGIAHFLRGLRHAWWALGAVTATFTALAFIGAPQVVLIAATVAVFGPTEGIVVSWVATLVSAQVGFLLGRAGGASALSKLTGGRGGRAVSFIGRNGFWASLIIRFVPSGPFILCNMALGAAKVSLASFIGGTGLGILPKICLVAFGAHGLGEVMKGQNQGALWFFVAATLVYLVVIAILRPMLLRGQAKVDTPKP